MPMWPFGRKRSSKMKGGGPTPIYEGKQPAIASQLGNVTTVEAVSKKPGRRHSKRRRRRSSRGSSSPERRDSLDSAENDTTTPPRQNDGTAGTRGSIEDRNTGNLRALTVPISKTITTSPHLRPITRDFTNVPLDLQQLPAGSHQSLPNPQGRGRLQKTQTLRSLRESEVNIPRRKSSKRKKEDQIREEEVRAMSTPVPQKRAATYSGSMLRRDSKKMRGSLNRRLERPTSNVSLPLEDSIHSSMSGDTENRAFRVSALDVFSARPTIRYSFSAQQHGTSPYINHHGHVDAAWLSRSGSKKGKEVGADGERDGEQGLERTKTNRVGDRADHLDAKSLRELMERDQRRRERKRKLDDETLHRKLEKRAERQRKREAKEARKPTDEHPSTNVPAPPTKSPDRQIGLGIERPPQSRRENGVAQPGTGDATKQEPDEMRVDDSAPAAETRSVEEASQQVEQAEQAPEAQGINSEQALAAKSIESEGGEPKTSEETQDSRPMSEVEPGTASPGREEATPLETPVEEPVVATAQEVRYAHPPVPPTPPPRSPMRHVRGPSNVSEVGELLSESRQRRSEASEPASKSSSTERRSSDSGRRFGSLMSVFRRSHRKSSTEKGKTSPSEVSFSNTSRESMTRQPLPAHLLPKPAVASTSEQDDARRVSAVPKRTTSKFREDLPESFTSPPVSRLQSPELQENESSADTGTTTISARRGQVAPSNIVTDGEEEKRLSNVEMHDDASASGPASSPLPNPADSPASPGAGRGSRIMSQSQSLASVDSEGSWLSGKPMKRRSAQGSTSHHLSHGSMGSMSRHPEEGQQQQPNAEGQPQPQNTSYEDLGMPEEEYFNRLTPRPDDSREAASPSTPADVRHTKRALEEDPDRVWITPTDSEVDEYGDMRHKRIRDSTDEARGEGAADEVLHGGASRQPTVIHVHRQSHVKSREGLVNEYLAGAPEAEGNGPRTPESQAVESQSDVSGSSGPSSPVQTSPVRVERATSVDWGKRHARHMSAGSAKLLDISSKRSSAGVTPRDLSPVESRRHGATPQGVTPREPSPAETRPA